MNKIFVKVAWAMVTVAMATVAMYFHKMTHDHWTELTLWSFSGAFFLGFQIINKEI